MRLVADCRAGSGLPKGLSLGSGLQPFMRCKVKIATKFQQCLVAIAWFYAHGNCCTAQGSNTLSFHCRALQNMVKRLDKSSQSCDKV